EGSLISFKEITRTKKACENEYLTLQEEHYFMALESASHYEVSGTSYAYGSKMAPACWSSRHLRPLIPCQLFNPPVGNTSQSI
ncbi:MAG TPA: hypothetical protein VLD65_06175, partial [Anaerolineales bacterium]|nr:hypothetical protein [Anaerolineales bacterium]